MRLGRRRGTRSCRTLLRLGMRPSVWELASHGEDRSCCTDLRGGRSSWAMAGTWRCAVGGDEARGDAAWCPGLRRGRTPWGGGDAREDVSCCPRRSRDRASRTMAGHVAAHRGPGTPAGRCVELRYRLGGCAGEEGSEKTRPPRSAVLLRALRSGVLAASGVERWGAWGWCCHVWPVRCRRGPAPSPCVLSGGKAPRVQE